MIRTAFAAVLAILALTTAAHADTRFLAAFDDVPLAPGLSERAGAAFAFTSPDGGISETVAAGVVEEGGVRAYYRAALPALGWALETDAAQAVYLRGRERLTLVFARGSDGALSVRYRIVARPASLALH